MVSLSFRLRWLTLVACLLMQACAFTQAKHDSPCVAEGGGDMACRNDERNVREGIPPPTTVPGKAEPVATVPPAPPEPHSSSTSSVFVDEAEKAAAPSRNRTGAQLNPQFSGLDSPRILGRRGRDRDAELGAARRESNAGRLKADASRSPQLLDDATTWARLAAEQGRLEELKRKFREQLEAQGSQRSNLQRDRSDGTAERIAELRREMELKKLEATQGATKTEASPGEAGGAVGGVAPIAMSPSPAPVVPNPAESSPSQSGWENDGRGRSDTPDSALNPALKREAERIDAHVKGSAGVSSPDRAREGQAFNVVLQVSRDSSAQQLLQSLKKEAPENDVLKARDDVILTPRMSASLSGHGFEILPKEAIAQEVSAGEPTTWTWTVKPVESGRLTLTFTLSRILFSEGKETARHYSYRQNVEVEVNPMRFVEKYWQWLATTIAIPLGLWLWKLWKKPADGPHPQPAQRWTPGVRRRDVRQG